ncbi:unnamed protein product [Colias eurytheme]|nr:unnamed protein product [Colias eurytheme]
MSFLVPTNSSLIGLSKDQLRHKRVCEKHFDRYQFDEEGKRLRHSYPCLFTDDEIAHGVPLSSSETVQNALSDHNYHKVESDENENITDNMLVIGRAGDDYHEHPSCIPAIPVVMKRPTDMADQTSCSLSKEIEFHTLCEDAGNITEPTVEEKTTHENKSIIQKRKDFMKKIAQRKENL